MKSEIPLEFVGSRELSIASILFSSFFSMCLSDKMENLGLVPATKLQLGYPILCEAPASWKEIVVSFC